jgi:hypothetical protein
MHLFCSQINNSLNNNFLFVDLRFKKKYIYILKELLRLNLIKSFSFNKNIIRIYFRYFKSKSIFFLNCKMTSSYIENFSNKKIIKKIKNENGFLDFFFSSKISFNEKNLLFFKGSGGIYALRVFFINDV